MSNNNNVKLNTSVILDMVLLSNEFQRTFVVESGEDQKLVSNKKNWKRDSKRRLDEQFGMPDSYKEFGNIWPSDWGIINETLLQQSENLYFLKRNKQQAPWHRMYAYMLPAESGGEYMLDIWTTHDDQKIIGWSISGD